MIRQQKRIEEDQIRRLNRTEDLVQARYDSTNQHQAPIRPYPVRRTCIRDGDRSIEVAKFTTEKLKLLANIPFTPFDYYQDEVFNQDDASNSRQTQSHVRLSLSSENSMNSLDTSSRRSSATSSSKSGQSIFALPSKIDRNSIKTMQLKDALAETGIETVFGDLETSNRSQVISYKQECDMTASSTLF